MMTEKQSEREEKKNKHETCRCLAIVDRKEISHYSHNDFHINSLNAFDYVHTKQKENTIYHSL